MDDGRKGKLDRRRNKAGYYVQKTSEEMLVQATHQALAARACVFGG
jgi:hypothetical protein